MVAAERPAETRAWALAGLSRLKLSIFNRLGPRLPPPTGEVFVIRGFGIIEPSVRAPHKEGLRFLSGTEVPR